MRVPSLALALIVLATLTPGARQQTPTPPQGVLLEPLGQAGEALFPAFEGWGPTKDGSQVLLLGYFNRNKGTELDIPIGPDNRIEPGGPDFGQPTHFHLGRQYGVFAIVVPKDFGTKKLTWTLRANGHTSTVSFWTNPPYWIDFYKNHANGNEPPRIKFAPNGPEIIGPPVQRTVKTLSGAVGQPRDAHRVGGRSAADDAHRRGRRGATGQAPRRVLRPKSRRRPSSAAACSRAGCRPRRRRAAAPRRAAPNVAATSASSGRSTAAPAT